MGAMRAAILGVVLAITIVGCQNQSRKHDREILSFQRPTASTARVEGQKYPYCLWYDPDEWMIWETPFVQKEEIAEWNLVLLDPKERKSIGKHTKIQAETSTYPYKDKNLSNKDFKALIQNRIVGKGHLETFVELNSEQRFVNNIKIFAWNFKFKFANSEEITSLIYFYSDNEGSVALVSFTPSKLWDENKEKMENLLNGFCLLQSTHSP